MRRTAYVVAQLVVHLLTVASFRGSNPGKGVSVFCIDPRGEFSRLVKLFVRCSGRILSVSTKLFVLANSNKHPPSADTPELYLVTGDHEKSQGMSLILYPQSEAHF